MRQCIDVATPAQGHSATVDLWRNHIKPHTFEGGIGRIVWEPINPDSREAMRKLFHGPVLLEIAEQVRLIDPETGQRVRYAPAVWKEHLKDLFCPLTMAPNGNWSKSTERLSDPHYATFITASQAYAVMDLGVEFSELS
jgi:hypothetical protein